MRKEQLIVNILLSIVIILALAILGTFAYSITKENPVVTTEKSIYPKLSKQQLQTLRKETKYFKGEGESPYVLLEYTNFACPACRKFHNSGVIDNMLEKYKGKIRLAAKHFHFFEPAKPVAEFTECVADQLSSKGFYDVVDLVFAEGLLDVAKLTEKAVEMGANKAKIEECLASDKHIATYKDSEKNGAEIFGIESTPTTVFINIETGEYLKSRDIDGSVENFIK